MANLRLYMRSHSLHLNLMMFLFFAGMTKMPVHDCVAVSKFKDHVSILEKISLGALELYPYIPMKIQSSFWVKVLWS